jgi:hypothetical protein
MTLAKELIGVGISPMAASTIPTGTVAAVTATGSSAQATAIELAAGVNRVTGSDGVRLPSIGAGESVMVINDTASTIKVWPPVGGAIQVVGTSFGSAVANAASSLTTYATWNYICVVAGASSLWAVTK